jgi:hypothetical protein
VVVALTVGLILLAGVVIAVSRSILAGRRLRATDSPDGKISPDQTLIRSWIAIVLVGALAFFCAVAFEIDDSTLRSTLLGGLVASAGTAVAFYFATKSSDQARQDIINAALGKIGVPLLKGKTKSDVNAALATLPLHLNPVPANADDAWIAVAQDPAANTVIVSGSPVQVTFAGQVPTLLSMSPAAATSALEAVNLILRPTPASPGANTTAQGDQTPSAGSAPPDDRTISVTFQ